MEFQLRGQDKNGNDSGEINFFEDCTEALEKFINGGWWKMSWTMANGKRVRLLREDKTTIQITYPAEDFEKDI